MIFIYPITIQTKAWEDNILNYWQIVCYYRANNISYLGMNLWLNVDIKYLIVFILYISESSWYWYVTS